MRCWFIRTSLLCDERALGTLCRHNQYYWGWKAKSLNNLKNVRNCIQSCWWAVTFWLGWHTNIVSTSLCPRTHSQESPAVHFLHKTVCSCRQFTRFFLPKEEEHVCFFTVWLHGSRPPPSGLCRHKDLLDQCQIARSTNTHMTSRSLQIPYLVWCMHIMEPFSMVLYECACILYVRMYCPPRLPWLQVTCAAGWGHPVRVYCTYIYCVYVLRMYVHIHTIREQIFHRKLLWIGLLLNSKDHYVRHSLRILSCGTSLPVSVLWMQVSLAFMSVLASALNFLFSPALSFPVRLFHVQEGYCSKLKRDDLKHTIGLDVHSEEVAKTVPILSNSVYGHPVLYQLETPDRKYVRVATVNKEFYRSCGANMTPQWTWSTFMHVVRITFGMHTFITCDTNCMYSACDTNYTYV